MIEYPKSQIKSEEEFEKTQMQKWLAESHYWVNEYQTFHCRWCGKLTTTVLEGDVFLCPKNPALTPNSLTEKQEK